MYTEDTIWGCVPQQHDNTWKSTCNSGLNTYTGVILQMWNLLGDRKVKIHNVKNFFKNLLLPSKVKIPQLNPKWQHYIFINMITYTIYLT